MFNASYTSVSLGIQKAHRGSQNRTLLVQTLLGRDEFPKASYCHYSFCHSLKSFHHNYGLSRSHKSRKARVSKNQYRRSPRKALVLLQPKSDILSPVTAGLISRTSMGMWGKTWGSTIKTCSPCP